MSLSLPPSVPLTAVRVQPNSQSQGYGSTTDTGPLPHALPPVVVHVPSPKKTLKQHVVEQFEKRGDQQVEHSSQAIGQVVSSLAHAFFAYIKGN